MCGMYGSFHERPKANVRVVTYERKGRDKTTNALSLREGFKSTQRANLSRYLQNTNFENKTKENGFKLHLEV